MKANKPFFGVFEVIDGQLELPLVQTVGDQEHFFKLAIAQINKRLAIAYVLERILDLHRQHANAAQPHLDHRAGPLIHIVVLKVEQLARVARGSIETEAAAADYLRVDQLAY